MKGVGARAWYLWLWCTTVQVTEHVLVIVTVNDMGYLVTVQNAG